MQVPKAKKEKNFPFSESLPSKTTKTHHHAAYGFTEQEVLRWGRLLPA